MDSTIAGPMNAHCESVNMTSEVSEHKMLLSVLRTCLRIDVSIKLMTSSHYEKLKQ
jgi:hypothetical protein